MVKDGDLLWSLWMNSVIDEDKPNDNYQDRWVGCWKKTEIINIK